MAQRHCLGVQLIRQLTSASFRTASPSYHMLQLHTELYYLIYCIYLPTATASSHDSLQYNVSVYFQQKAAFKHFAELRKFSLANVASIDTHDALLKHFKPIDRTMLREIASYLHLVSPVKADGDDKYTTDFLLKLLVSTSFIFQD